MKKNKSKRYNRAQIEWMKIYSVYEFLILDYIIFKSWPKEEKGGFFDFHVNKVAKETNISRAKVSKIFSTFTKRGFLTKVGNGQKSYFKINYSRCYEYSVNEQKLLENADKECVSETDETVANTNSSVSNTNSSVLNGNRTVSTAVPISNKEVEEEVEEVSKEVPKKIKSSEEYKKLLKDIEDHKNFNRVNEMEKLIIENEDALRENRDYYFVSTHLKQCKEHLINFEKYKKSAFNKFYK
jgi:hypothetical protein